MDGDTIKIYKLVRKKDIHGISGTGIVGYIAKMPSGRCILEWVSNHPTITIFANLDEILIIHGHNDTTMVESLDEPKGRKKRKKQ